MAKSDMAQHWPDELELEITGIAQGGAGVGRFEERPVFATGALPGETVRIRLRDRQTSFARGDVVAVLQPSPQRIASACPKEAACGAAGWRWIEYDAQLRFKAEILRDQLRHLGGIDVPISAIHGAEEAVSAGAGLPSGRGWSYRTTAELHYEHGKLGYYAPGSRRVSELGQCCLHHPLINETIAALQLLKEDLPTLRGVTLRCSPVQGQVLAVLEGEGRWEAFAQRWMSVCPALVGVMQRTRGGVKRVRGQPYLEHSIDNLRWHVSAGSFFQINARQTAKLIERVRTLMAVRPGERMLDLFCGVGTFAVPLRIAGAQVTGIESYAPAIEDARRSAELNGIDGIFWYAGPVEKILERLRGPFDGAVLDPPRRGCEAAALERLASLGPRRLVYVSCHPGTLARDCKVLGRHGYTVKRTEVIDLFPHTEHVESIVFLERA